jgi:G3E family GTPase
MTIEHAPVITLVDATRIDLLVKAVKRLVETQIREADVCFVNKVDTASPADITKTENMIKEMNPKVEVSHMSSETGQGILYACDLIENRISPRYDEAVEEELLRKQYKG